jgi:flagellar motor switch protein FliN
MMVDAAASGNSETGENAGARDDQVQAGDSTAKYPPAAEFEDARTTAGNGSRPSIDIVMDVPVTLSLEVGRATMSVGELLQLGQGAVVELDRAVGEPLDVLVNGALVAKGEIVLVNERFGIRLTSIVDRGNSSESE